VVSKLSWIKQQRATFRQQERETPRELLNGESHFLWGRRCLLAVEERNGVPSVEVRPGRIHLRVRPRTNEAGRRAILDEWYRAQVKTALPGLLTKWQSLIRVKPRRLFVRRMRTKWGSSNPAAGSIRLNTDLAKKPRACLEYIVVHELVHLREPTHNARFVALMDRLLPTWRHQRKALNRLPLRHEEWAY
jgi:predicted metal-dependent hydrolase